jgi:hypothetical protein
MRLLSVACAVLVALAAPADGRAAPAAKGAGPVYQRWPAMAVGVPLPGARRGVMTVEVGVEAVDPKLAEHLKLLQPRLRAAWFERLQVLGAGMRPGAPPDADHIARELQAETDRVVGRKGVTFLLGTIIVR